MFKRILVTILFTSITSFVICESKCEEYILIMAQNTCHGNTLTPTKLKDIPLDRFDDCSTNATDELSYKDFIANKSCVIELKYSEFEPNCTSIVSKDQSEDINLIYVNGNNTITHLTDISNSSEQLYNVMQCLYTDNICLDDEDMPKYLNNTNASTKTSHGSTDTIIALVGKEKTTTPIGKVIDHTHNVTDFNCTKNINATEITNHDHFIALSLNVIRKYRCQNKSNSDLINNTSLLPTHTVNVYFETDFIYNNNNKSMDYVFCPNNFDAVNNQTQSIHCNVIENETVSTALSTEAATTTSQTTEMSKITENTTNSTTTSKEIETFTTIAKSEATSSIELDITTITTLSPDAITETLQSTVSETVTTPTHSPKFFRNHFKTLSTSTALSVAKESITTPTIEMTTQTENSTPTDSDVVLLGAGFFGSRSSKIEQSTTFDDKTTLSTTEEKPEVTTDKSTPSTTKKETEHTTMKSEKPADVTESPRNAITIGPKVTVTTTHLPNVTSDSRYSKEYSKIVPIDVYTLQPWAIVTLVFSIIGVVSVVGLYAGYIFRPKKERYRPAPTRDWANMEDTAF